MICRLCLMDLNNSAKDFIQIFPEGNESRRNDAVADIINKHFHIDIQFNDPVSTKICQLCWQHVDDFNRFYLIVNEKQQQLFLNESNQLLCSSPTSSVASALLPRDEKQNDIKESTVLIEPEIYATTHASDSDCYEVCGMQFPTCDSDNEKDSLRDIYYESAIIENDFQEEETTAVRKPKAIKNKSVNRTKRNQKSLKTKPLAVPTRSLRSRIVRPIESNDTETTSLMAIPTTELLPQQTQVKKLKRGRPKGVQSKTNSNKQKKVTLSEEVLDQRRALVREMDEFIAANVKLDCCICGIPLEDFRDLKAHFREQHNCNGYVKCCNNRYNKRALYVDHLNLHRDPEYFRCKLCKKNYVNRNSYEMHILRFHTDKQMMAYECDVCGQRYAKMYLLTMHKKSHKGTERKEVCKLCDRAFRTPFELKAHEKRMHDESFEPVICDICGSHFRNEANFITHKKTVHREGPPEPEVQCQLCGRWLRDMRCLRRHVSRHKDGSVFKCDKCDVVKMTRAALSSHIRYHHSSKRHQCTLCGKEFKIPRNLKEHMATHTGIDLYACPFCPRTFKSHANMHNHKKKMHSNDWVPKYSMPSNATMIKSDVATLAQTVNDGNNDDGDDDGNGDIIETIAASLLTENSIS